ncbi:MAG: peptide chain release factor N(5)-glutamine methyltransferase [Erysipelotrichaceae bacterium]|nr:peptide chain release factor N(5)-glutamine methyltransferase [Erysipelotrichaceae bacterium]
MPTYREVLYEAMDRISDNPDLADESLQILMLELSNMSHNDLYLNYEKEIDPEIHRQFEKGFKRLLNNEPLQYILGFQWFYGYKFKVSPDVLIPRYETEELVSNVLADSDYFFKDLDKIDIADVGTGAGCIGVTLKLEEPKYRMTATDISKEALDLAKENADDLGAEVEFMQGDMLQPLIDKGIKLDILVSNPPYIPVNQEVQTSVREYEPHVALFGGDDGLYFYRKIFENANKVLKERSFMAFEIGFDEKEALEKEVSKYFPNDRYEILKDINGKDRMLFVYHNLNE